MGRKYKQDEINDILGDLGNVTQNNYVAPTVKSNVAPAMAVVAQQPRTVQPTVTMNTQPIPQTPSTVQPKKEKTSILKTLGNVATNMGTGALKGMEGAADTISDLVVNPYERYSNYVIDLVTKGKKTADENLKDLKKMQERDIKRNLTKEFQDTVGYTKTLPEWEKGSLVKSNNFGGQVAQGVGGMVPALLFGSVAGTAPELVNTTNLAGKEKLIASLGNVGRTYASQLPSNLMLGASSYGGGLEEALNQGYDINKARQYGLANAAIEQGTEYLTGGIPGLSGKGGIDNYLEPLIDKSSKGYANDLLKYLYRAGGEGLEETAGTYLDALAQKGILGKDIDWNETNKEALQSGLVGAATGAILDSGQLVGDLGNTRTQKTEQRQQEKVAQEPISTQQNIDNTKQLDYNNAISERRGDLNEREITGANQTGINQEINREQSTNDSRTGGEGDGGVRVLNETKDYKQVKDNIDNLKATHKRGAFFDSYTEDEFKTFKTYQTPDGKSSISVKPDGDITALVSEGKKGMATDLLMKARENGGTKMDCYGKFLKELYEQHGFKAVARVHYGRGYNEQMDNYIDNAIKEGKAKDDSDFDIYFMMKNNDDIDTVRNNIGKYETTNIDDLPYMDYDEAYNFRDSQLEQQGSGEGETNAIVKSDGNVVTAPIGTKGDNKLANIEINVNDGGSGGGNNNNNRGLATRDSGDMDDARILENYKDRKANKKASFAERTDDFLHSVVRGLFDRGEIINRIGKNHNDKELYPLYDWTFTADGSANFNIGDGKDGYQTNLSGEKVGESLDNCWKPVEDAGLVREMNAYLYELHNIDRWNQFNEDGTRKYVFSENHSDEVSKQNIKELLRIFPQLEDMAKPILQYQKNLLNIAVESGQVSQKMADKLNEMYKNYVPTWRDKDKQSYSTLKKGLNNISVDSPLKQATGSKEDLLPLKEVQAQMTKNMFKSAKMNLFGQQLFKDVGDLNQLKEIGMSELKGMTEDEQVLKDGEAYLDDYLKKLAPNNIPVDTVNGEKTMTVYFDGKKVSMPINDEIETAIKPAKPNNRVAKFTSKINDFKRGVITQYNPGFSISNALKDAPDAMLNSKYGKEFPTEYAKTVKEMLGKGLAGKDLELFNQYCALGAYSNSIFDTTEGFKKDSKLNKTVGFLPNAISDINDIIEQIPRFTEFKLSLKHGATLAEAMYNAAEVTTNFKRGGTITKSLDAYGTTFLNASMAGFYKQLRNITEQPNGTTFLKFAGKLMALGLTPAVINSLLYASPFGDDDEKKEAKEAYESLRQYEKDDYLLWYKGDGKFLKIPKGRAVSIPAIVYNAAMNKAKGKEVDLKETLNSILNQIGPNNPLSDNTILSFSQVKLLDPKSQGTSWSGSPIESSYLQDKRPGQRYDSKTDEFSKWLGGKLDVSPKKINYLLKQNSGIIGDMILPFITPKSTGKSELSRFGNFLTNRFSTDTVTSNNITEEFYNRLTEYNWDKNDNRPEISTPMAEVKSKYMGNRSSEIAKIRKDIETINADKNISKNEKYEQTRELQKEINNIAKDALVNVDKIKKNSESEYQVGNKYYVMKDGQMSSVKDETANSAVSYGLSVGDYVDITGKYGSIKADKDANGVSIPGSKKQKFIDYVNSKKELTKEQKISIIQKYYKKYNGGD